jgi:TatD DNase family protein
VVSKQERSSIGELGLDFRKDVLESNPKDLQIRYFKKQLEMAANLDKPATIHCVRAHGEMLKLLKDLNKAKLQTKPHLIMHSYGGSPDITRSMLKLTNLNIYFSLCLRRSAELAEVIPI